MTGLGRERHLSFFGSGRSNRKRQLPFHQTASGRLGREADGRAGLLELPFLAGHSGLSLFGQPHFPLAKITAAASLC